MSAWISAAITTPPLVDGESEFVLVATIWTPHPIVAKHRFTEDPTAGRDEPPGWSDWIMFGRDGYLVEGVTHWMKLPEMPRRTMKPEIRKTLVCSTAHLPKTVATKFSEETYCPEGIVFGKIEYGYLIRYFQSKDMADRRLWPTTLRKVVEIAEQNKCSMIMFDCDGLTLDGVQTFDW